MKRVKRTTLPEVDIKKTRAAIKRMAEGAGMRVVLDNKEAPPKPHVEDSADLPAIFLALYGGAGNIQDRNAAHERCTARKLDISHCYWASSELLLVINALVVGTRGKARIDKKDALPLIEKLSKVIRRLGSPGALRVRARPRPDLAQEYGGLSDDLKTAEGRFVAALLEGEEKPGTPVWPAAGDAGPSKPAAVEAAQPPVTKKKSRRKP